MPLLPSMLVRNCPLNRGNSNVVKRKSSIYSLILLGFSIIGCQPHYRLISSEGNGATNLCGSLPNSFSESDLVGRWQSEYFGGLASDKLFIKDNGLYQQVFNCEPKSFESEWLTWWFEIDDDGYGLLHLDGMRRCDDIESICNYLEGGLPVGEIAINQCKNEYIQYSNEGLLIVVPMENEPGSYKLVHPRLAGSDWTYSFRIIE